MMLRERVPLSSLTTLRVGGEAILVADCAQEDDVRQALALAQKRNLPWRVLGEGSNVLAQDAGFEGLVIRLCGGTVSSIDKGAATVLAADAGVSWDAFVREAASRNLWGIENLAGIPGTVGAAPVQNIGAYGSEVKDTLVEVQALDTRTGELLILGNKDCGFGYRESRFKHDPGLVILRVSFLLSRDGIPNLAYKDLRVAAEGGADLSTPSLIGDAVRAIRARKFPDLATHGTAGSFFKNPTISAEAFVALSAAHPDLPGYPNDAGVKISLAFVLDRVLGLRGYGEGNVRLFEKQPLVLVADTGATASEIDAFGKKIAERVHEELRIMIEREVRMFP